MRTISGGATKKFLPDDFIMIMNTSCIWQLTVTFDDQLSIMTLGDMSICYV